MVETTPDAVTAPEWASYNDEQLLAVRMCDLKLSLAGTEIEQRIARVNAEIEARGLVHPHYYLSTNGSHPTAFPPSPCRSTSPIRGWRNSSSRKCWRSKAATSGRV
jgi:hypothetical protein